MENLDTKKEEENINSLCKKYFTPELCDKPITENKAALKNKLFTQLLKYGDWICDKKFSQQGGSGVFCEIVLNTIDACWKNWKKESRESYSSYFITAIKNNVLGIINRKKEEKNIISLDKIIEKKDDSSDITLGDLIPDKKNGVYIELERKYALVDVEHYLKAVDAWFKIRQRSDWNKALVTAELYEGLHQYFDYYPNKKKSQFSFIDENIYNLSAKPLNKELSEILGKDEGQLSRARQVFRKGIESLLKKDLEI